MSKTLSKIAQDLKGANQKVQLIYAFNGMGKTRLSREFKELISPKNDKNDEVDSPKKVIYYNAFTEDLFYWDNNFGQAANPKLKIHPNSFTNWIIRSGDDRNIVANFQRYVNNKLEPKFNQEYKIKDTNGNEITVPAFSEVTFSFARGNDEINENIKISKGEESNFIWSIFYTLLEEIVSNLNEDTSNRDDTRHDELKYVFIDDPVSSLDENHLITLAVDLAGLIKSSSYENDRGLKFIITTHSPLFYNVLYNEFNTNLYKKQLDGNGKQKCVYNRSQTIKYRLDKNADGTFKLEDLLNDHPFSYHLYLLSELNKATADESVKIKKYHFNFIRNILEKTATFLGYERWQDLLPKTDKGEVDPFAARILNLYSHAVHSGEEGHDITNEDSEKLRKLVRFITEKYSFWQGKKNV